MSYDIEDYIDDFISSVGADDNVGILHKASRCLRTFMDRRRLANQFQEIKTLVMEASEPRKRYMLDQCIPSTDHIIVDPRLSALCQKSASLVGIDSQKEKIVRWVMDEEQQLKVMSIVGFGGLGKTTLANEVYREVGGKFNCKAFLSISQKPDIIKLLNSLTLQLGLQPYSHAFEPQDLINNIVEHLQDSRYLIIVDDLWDIRAWNTISCAFPRNNHHGRVIVTTRIENVARVPCGNHGFIHIMKPLSEQDSRKLFFDRIFGSEDACPPDFIEVSCKILKKCGGLPLAIITVASMIACQPTRSKGQWTEYIQNSLAVEFSTNPTYEDMMYIIDFSYKNLPRHLKACFMYLGIYPEDHIIERIELVRRWVAEGFVSCSRGQHVWDVAEIYFRELVNRNIIQPAYEYGDDTDIMMAQCRVHDMMLELILRKCREDNFISLIDGREMILEGQDNVVIRRLTINLCGTEGRVPVMLNSWHLSHVRSLNIFSGNCQIPNMLPFKFIRLLFLYADTMEKDIDLIVINHLSQLRYLKVVGELSDKVLLPAQIRGLRLLETLDLSDLTTLTGGDCCLREIVDVPRLSHVSLSSGEEMRLPDGIGKAKSMLTLNGFSLAKSSSESITGLGELTALSDLFLTGQALDPFDNGGVVPLPMETLMPALVNSLEKLGNLKDLALVAHKTVYCSDTMLGSSFSPPFYNLEWLNLSLCIFSHVPRWIGHLRCLRRLVLVAKQILQDDVDIIGTRLTSLLCFRLRISRIPTERIVISGSTGFKAIKWFEFDCDGVSCLTFEAGAMPDLEELKFDIDPYEWDKATPVGLQHLPSLERIQVWAAKPYARETTWDRREEAARGALRDVFQEAVDQR